MAAAAAAISPYVCAGVGEDKHQALELVCCLRGECVHALLVCVSACFCVFFSPSLLLFCIAPRSQS